MKDLSGKLKKKGFLLVILVSLLWWWHFYRTRRFNAAKMISNPVSVSPEDIKAIEEKENKLAESLLKKALESFREDYGRAPKNTGELIKKGYISRESLPR